MRSSAGSQRAHRRLSALLFARLRIMTRRTMPLTSTAVPTVASATPVQYILFVVQPVARPRKHRKRATVDAEPHAHHEAAPDREPEAQSIRTRYLGWRHGGCRPRQLGEQEVREHPTREARRAAASWAIDRA